MDNILRYIEDTSPNFYELLNELDVDNDLIINKDGPVTFLMPNASKINEIINLSKNDDERALAQVLTLFIHGQFSSTYDWTNCDRIVNFLNRQIEISKTDRSKILFSNNCEITLNRKFRGGQYAAIYDITSRELPPTGKKQTTKKKTQEPVQRKTRVDVRGEIYSAVVSSSEPEQKCHEFVNSFVAYLSRESPGMLEAIAPFLDHSPIVNLFILFEPGKGQYFFIDEKVLNDWYSRESGQVINDYVNATMRRLKYPNLTEAINECRDSVLVATIPQDAISSIDSVYSDLINENRIGHVKDVLPKNAFQYILATSKHYNLKLMQDELRMIYDFLVDSGDSPKSIILQIYKKLKLLPFFDDISTLNGMSKPQFLANLGTFVNTTNFLYLAPSKESEFGGRKATIRYASPESDLIDTVSCRYKPKQSNYDITKHFEELHTSNNLPPELIELARRIAAKSNYDN